MNERSSSMDDMPVGRALQKLLSDMKVTASDTRELLRHSTGQSGEQFTRLRDRTRDTLEGIEQRLGPMHDICTPLFFTIRSGIPMKMNRMAAMIRNDRRKINNRPNTSHLQHHVLYKLNCIFIN